MVLIKYILLLLSVIFLVFFNTRIPENLGGFESGKTILTYFPILAFFFLNVLVKKIRYSKDAIYIILLAFIIIIFKKAIDQNYIKNALAFFIIPMIASMSFDSLTRKELILLRKVVIFFFITECGLAIVEWILKINFFLYEGLSGVWFEFFRSTSLMGHPLANAQIIAVFMTFIVVSDFKKKIVQILLFFLGYVSLFCFSTRGAILVITVFTAPYFLWKINKTTPKNRKWIIKFGIFCMFCILIYLIIYTPLGGRLTGMELMDQSGKSRLDVLYFYNYYDTTDQILWGHPGLYNYIMGRLGESGVENGIICLILEYGIIFAIIMLLLLFRFQFHKLSVYSKFEKWLLLSVFYIIGTMNPNLAQPVQWTMWIFAYYAFRPELLNVQNETINRQKPSIEKEVIHQVKKY